MSGRDLRGSSLAASSLLPADDGRDPMESMGNLMDVMLVFACGLLLALVANWNIDLASDGSQAQPSAVALEGELSEVEGGIDPSSGDFDEVGTVYEDRDTGDLYLVR